MSSRVAGSCSSGSRTSTRARRSCSTVLPPQTAPSAISWWSRRDAAEGGRGSCGCSGPHASIAPVLEGLLYHLGMRPAARSCCRRRGRSRPAPDRPRRDRAGPGRPASAADVHDRPGRRAGLRRRDQHPSGGRRLPALGAHRGRHTLRTGRIVARPRRCGAGPVRLRPGPQRADAAGTALRTGSAASFLTGSGAA